MNSTDQIRAGLATLAAAEEANPSPVWAPITQCLCPPDADYHLPYCPDYEGADKPDDFTADEISRPDEAIPGTDF